MRTNPLATFLSAAIALLAFGTVDAQAFLGPTNPTPQVKLAWTQGSGGSLTNNYLYWGVASGQYTNKVPLGVVTNTTVNLPARGVAFFFAVTCQDNHGLESQFSNEVNYTAPTPPGAPSMQPITVLTVQWAPSPAGTFVESGMNWSLSTQEAQQYYRLHIAHNPPILFAAASPSLERVNFKPSPPPIPGK